MGPVLCSILINEKINFGRKDAYKTKGSFFTLHPNMTPDGLY
jgi:hypothetical protein